MSRAVRANLAGVVLLVASLTMGALGLTACNSGSSASQVAPSTVAPTATGQQQGSATSAPARVVGATPALPTSASAAVVGFQQWADVLCGCQGESCTARFTEYAHWSNPAFRIIDAATTPVAAAESASLKAALERIARCSPQPAPL